MGFLANISIDRLSLTQMKVYVSESFWTHPYKNSKKPEQQYLNESLGVEALVQSGAQHWDMAV